MGFRAPLAGLNSLLDVIAKASQRLGRRVLLEELQEPISANAVRSALESVGLRSSPEVEVLHGWKNGTATDGIASVDDIHMFPGFYFLSLEDAAANYRSFVGGPRWRVGWLPLFANGGGDFYVLDVRTQGSSPVRHFRIDEFEHPVEFSSVRALMATLAVAFERRVFFVDSNGYLEMDDLVFAGTAAEFNPDIPWWRT